MKQKPTKGRRVVDPWDGHKKYSYAHQNWVYDTLREAHHKVKYLLHHKEYENLSEEIRNGLEAVHSVLYLAEGTCYPPVTLSPNPRKKV